jgi:hypothetical protein
MLCRLCNFNESIENSHVIPQLVFRNIKADSPTGFFRTLLSPNKREQDGDKQPLLCLECENKFSVSEKLFAQNIFVPFHQTDQDTFSYGPWLHYFLTSLAWRTLVLDLPSLEADQTISRSLLEPVQSMLKTMQSYLLGATHLGNSIRHHALAWTGGDECSPELAAAGPNVLIRRSTIGYALIEKHKWYAGVVHNLAGFIAVLNIKGNPRDSWFNTKIDPVGGTITQPQKVRSWIMYELFEALIDSHQTVWGSMSEKQQNKIYEGMKSNKTAPSLRHAARDAKIKIKREG